MAELKISFDTDAVLNSLSNVIRRKINNSLSVPVKQEIAGEYAAAVYRYVPNKTGKLADSARVVTEGNDVAIKYEAISENKNGKKTDYAPIQYEIPFENRTTPGTYDHWNRHLTTAERKAFYETCADIIKESFKNG